MSSRPRGASPCKVVAVAVVAVMCAVFVPGPASGQPPTPPDLAPPQFAGMVPLLTGTAGASVAESLGMKSPRPKPPGKAKAKKLQDTRFGETHDTATDGPSVALNPKDKKTLAVAHSVPTETEPYQCAVFVSRDGGKTFGGPVLLPTINASSACHSPRLLFTADGRRLYAVYHDLKPIFTGGSDIVVSYSDTGGATWSAPTVALEGGFDGTPPTGTFVFYDWPSIALSPDDDGDAWVHVAATRFTIKITPTTFAQECAIMAARSEIPLAGWSAQVLESSTGCGLGFDTVLQGPRIAAGPDGTVLAVWYSSGTDGWTTGTFEIRRRASSDHGATWNAVLAVVTESYETPFTLGPTACYYEWWSAMFPDARIDERGRAQVVYTRDPDPDPNSPEDGDIRHITSESFPFASWTSPVTVNDDAAPRAQGFAALAADHKGKELHLVWEDHRLSNGASTTPCLASETRESPNLLYDIFYARRVPGQKGWSKNFRVSDTSSVSGTIDFFGSRPDLTANDGNIFAVWIDRRGWETVPPSRSVFAPGGAAMLSRISKGGGVPK